MAESDPPVELPVLENPVPVNVPVPVAVVPPDELLEEDDEDDDEEEEDDEEDDDEELELLDEEELVEELEDELEDEELLELELDELDSAASLVFGSRIITSSQPFTSLPRRTAATKSSFSRVGPFARGALSDLISSSAISRCPIALHFIAGIMSTAFLWGARPNCTSSLNGRK